MGRRTGLQSKPTETPHAGEPLVLVPAVAAPALREDMLKAMSEALVLENPGSTAEALRALRNAYPDCPLALRLAALAVAMKRPQSGFGAAAPSWCGTPRLG
jgi:hypothetical protein